MEDRSCFRRIALVSGAALLTCSAARSAEPVSPETPPDTSRWECKFCPFEEAANSGEVEAGVGLVSDGSFRFGKYNGLEDDGPYLIGGGSWRYRGQGAEYWDFSARNLGLDTRDLQLEGGRQGRYGLFLEYREQPNRSFDTSRTPFRGAGSDTLTLPPGWVSAGTTMGMASLPGALHGVDIEHQRRRLDLGAMFIPAPHWETALRYRHETRDGVGARGGTFVVQSTILPVPIDYETDQVDASASYRAANWQARLAYYASLFSNGDRALVWDNPYSPLDPGAGRGRLALPPDNQFHQLMLSLAYQPVERAQLSGNLALGRMRQDESLLPATINPGLGVPLPRNSADARVDTLTANLRGNYAATSKLRLNAEYSYDDRDNKTPQDSFLQVLTDTFITVPRTNLPYSFTNSAIRAGADYRAAPRTLLSAGVEQEDRERSFAETGKTSEDRIWGRLRLQPAEPVDVLLRLAHGSRDSSGFRPVDAVQPPENPRHRAFNQADRERDTALVQVTVTPKDGVSLGLNADYAEDDYTRSAVGLTGDSDQSLGADASMVLRENLVVHGFVAREVIKSRQAGSQAFGAPDWTGRSRDTTETLGLGFERRALFPKFDVSGQYSYAKSTGEVNVSNGAAIPGFPDLAARLHLFSLYGTYRLLPDVSLKLGFLHERYRDSDWHVDGVAPDTVANVLSLGQGSPDYSVNVITFTANYRFGEGSKEQP